MRNSTPSSVSPTSSSAASRPASSESLAIRLYSTVAARTAWCQYTFRNIWYFANSSDSSDATPFSWTATSSRPVAGSRASVSACSSRSDVHLAVRHAAEPRVPLQVLDLVEVEAAADQALERARGAAADERIDARGRVGTQLGERRGHDRIGDEPRGQRLVVARDARGFQLLERVRERVVADVVEQTGERDEAELRRIDVVQRTTLAHDGERAARQVVDAERVVEARVRRARIHEMRVPELLDVAQPLEGRGIDDPHRDRVQPDRVPERVPDDDRRDAGHQRARLISGPRSGPPPIRRPRTA